MRRKILWIGTLTSASLAVASGYASWRYVPLASWSSAFPSLLTALSLMAGAVLVRLARNAPITSPSTFNSEDLGRFFDSLETLSQRLLWIFLQTMVAMLLVIISVVLQGLARKPGWISIYMEPIASGAMAAILVWLSWRLYLVARGDIGFLRLQRSIIENALEREKNKEVERIKDQRVNLKSGGGYGRQAS